MHISTSSMHISTPTEQGAKFGVCDTPVMASVESSLLMADTTPCDSANENSAIHWGECMICQKVTREELKCPSNGSRFDASEVYEAFAGRFEELRQLLEPNKPQHFKLHYLFDQDTLPNIKDKMLSNKGKWHKTCFVQFNSQQINRRQLRKRQLPETLNSAALTDTEPTELVGSTVPVSNLTDGRRKSSRSADHDTDKCIMCQMHSESGEPLHNVATSDCGKSFFEMATALQWQPLLTILTYAEQGTKGVEHDMKYHKSCSTSLFNSFKSNRSTASSQANLTISEEPAMLAARAFCNLTHYIEKKVEEREYYHTLPELSRMHFLYRKALGIESGIAESLLKEKLATHFKDQAEWVKRDGKTYSLFFLSGLRKDALSPDNSFEIIAKAAKIIRDAIFSHGPIYEFGNQQFQPGTQERSVPHVLKALVALILYPAESEPDDKPADTQPTLTIAQLFFNNTKKNTVSSDKFTRKNKAHETPLPIFLSMKVYNETRSMILVKMLYDYGVGITPNRLSHILDDVASAVCEGYRKEDLVVPQRLKKDEFTICHIDNVDVKTVSTGAQQEFHGTAISALQSNCHNRQGIHMGPTHYPPAVTRKLDLPLNYTRVHVSALNIKNVFLSPVVPEQRLQNPTDAAIFQSALTVQNSWVQNVQDHLNGKEIDKNSAVTWSAFNSAKSKNDNLFNLLRLNSIFINYNVLPCT